MKRHLLIFLFLFPFTGIAQHCGCANDSPDMKLGMPSCKKTVLNNNAKIYWQYDCNLSWLVFENSRHQKTRLYNMDRAFFPPGGIGLDFAAEYPTHFLLTNRIISGCCAPLEVILYNKETGRKQKNFGPVIFFSKQKEYPYIGFFTSPTYNSIIIQNVETNGKIKLSMPFNRLKKSLSLSGDNPALLFSPVMKNGLLQLNYRYSTAANSWLDDSLTVKLKRF